MVLSKFNESIFALSQIEILCNSLFKIFERELQQSFPEKNMFVSSANHWFKSLIYNRNSNGPRIEPYGTPQEMNFRDERQPLNSTYWNLLER